MTCPIIVFVFGTLMSVVSLSIATAGVRNTYHRDNVYLGYHNNPEAMLGVDIGVFLAVGGLLWLGIA